MSAVVTSRLEPTTLPANRPGSDVDQRGHQPALEGASGVDQVRLVVHLYDHAFCGLLDVAHVQLCQQVFAFGHRRKVTPLSLEESAVLDLSRCPATAPQ